MRKLYLKSVFPQMYLILSAAATFILNCSVVLTRRIYVFMTEYVGNQIDIAGFLIKRCTVGTSQFVRRDAL